MAAEFDNSAALAQEASGFAASWTLYKRLLAYLKPQLPAVFTSILGFLIFAARVAMAQLGGFIHHGIYRRWGHRWWRGD